MSGRWQTTKAVRIPCGVCGKIGTCTVSPDGRAFKCWRNGGKVYQMKSGVHLGGNGNATGHIGEAHRIKPKARIYATPEAAIETARLQVERDAEQGATLAGVWRYPHDALR